jgi:hypothetical protein
MRGGGLNIITVKCYSGYIYAGEPRSFEWGGVAYEVKEVERAWQEPGERHFRVKTGDNRVFELCYHEAEGRWSLTW